MAHLIGNAVEIHHSFSLYRKTLTTREKFLSIAHQLGIQRLIRLLVVGRIELLGIFNS